MENIICKSCGTQFTGEVCPKCGYNINISKLFENGITNKKYKEHLADSALAILVNNKLISKEKDFKHLVVEFGYLLLPDNHDEVSAVLKVVIPKKMFRNEKIFYFGVQKGKIMLLNESFNEAMFRKVSNDMLTMHKVDLNTINRNDYIMELY